MARSHGVIKVSIWNVESDFRRLSKEAQRLYMLLLSQPQINNCGVLPYTPERWARLAADETPQALARALRELERHRFVIVDEDVGELLIRTFVKHDRIEDQPNLKKSARRQVLEIESRAIVGCLASAHDWLVADLPEGVLAEARDAWAGWHRHGLPEPLFEGVAGEPLSEGVSLARGGTPTPGPTPGPGPAPTPDFEGPEPEAVTSEDPAREPAPASNGPGFQIPDTLVRSVE